MEVHSVRVYIEIDLTVKNSKGSLEISRGHRSGKRQCGDRVDTLAFDHINTIQVLSKRDLINPSGAQPEYTRLPERRNES